MTDRIAITGASGFVGRHLVAAAARDGFEVYGIVRQTQKESIVREAGGRAIHVHGLYTDALARAFKGCVAVVHLAQIGGERGGLTYESVNVAGTRSVLDAARQAAVPRVVFLSGLGVAHYGMNPRCTNRYFLSKWTCEVEIFRSDLQAVVFRPSYVLGPGGELVAGLLRDFRSGSVDVVGDGSYRIQPLAVEDATAAIVTAIGDGGSRHAVYDFVGPEAVSLRDFVARVAAVARSRGQKADYALNAIAVEVAEREAAEGGFRGVLRDELDCLLCDEVSDPQPLSRLLNRPLRALDEAVAAAVEAALEADRTA